MRDLPADLAEPLHILGETSEGWGLPPWALLALAAAAAIWWRARRRGAAAPEPAPVEVPSPPAVEPPPELAARIRDLQRRFGRGGGDPREGCHRLADLLREHLRGRLTTDDRRPVATLTAHEIADRTPDPVVARLFGMLSRFQFGRRPPRADDLERACDLALFVVGSGPPPPSVTTQEIRIRGTSA